MGDDPVFRDQARQFWILVDKLCGLFQHESPMFFCHLLAERVDFRLEAILLDFFLVAIRHIRG